MLHQYLKENGAGILSNKSFPKSMRWPIAFSLTSCVLMACTTQKTEADPGFIPVSSVANGIVTTTTKLGAPATTLAPGNLAQFCPEPVVIQLDSINDIYSSIYFEIVSKVSQGTPSVLQGRLIDPFNRTEVGVGVEIRLKSALLPGQSIENAVMADPQVLLGTDSVDQVYPRKDKPYPVVVAAPINHDDSAIVWTNRSQKSNAQTISDIAGVKILNPEASPGAIKYLKALKLLVERPDLKELRPDVDPEATTGTASIVNILDNFDTLGPALVGATPTRTLLTRAQLLSQVGWEPIPHALVTSPKHLELHGDCLGVVVPLIQKALFAVTSNPAAAISREQNFLELMGVPFDQALAEKRLENAISIDMFNRSTKAGQEQQSAGDINLARMSQVLSAQMKGYDIKYKDKEIPDKISRARFSNQFIDSSIK